VLSLSSLSTDESTLIRQALDFFDAKGTQTMTWWLAPQFEFGD